MNTKNTHTPGPWKTGEAIESDNTIPVITEWSSKGSRVIAYVTPKPCFDDTQAANARLIAAAPCLLSALQRLLHPMASEDDIENARAAIAEATGTPHE